MDSRDANIEIYFQVGRRRPPPRRRSEITARGDPTSFDEQLLRGGLVVTHASTRTEDLADLLDARATIRAGLTPCPNLRERSMPLANFFVELAIRDAFADADEHGGGGLLELIIVFST